MGNNAPEIRFKGFTDAWEQRTIGEYGDFYYGKGAPKWSVTEDATTPCVRYGEMYTKFTEKIDRVYSYTNVDPADLKFSKGTEVLVPRVGEDPLDFANCSWLSIPDVAIGEMISVYNTEQNPLFVAYYINSQLKRELAKRVEGGNVSNLYYSTLEDIKVSFPCKAEQEKIAILLDSLTNTITLHKRKLDGMRELKKGYLQQMFPQAGERVPRVRFAGFTGEWQERKLGDISIKISEKNKENQYNETFTNSAEHGIISQRDFFDKDISNSKNLDGYFIVRPDDFVYNPRISNFAPVGPIKRNRLGRAGVMSPLYYVFRLRDGDHTFIEKYFESVYWHDFMNMNGDNGVRSDRFNIRDSILGEMPIPFPSVTEQNMIGSFLYNLDGQIAAQTAKLDQLRQLKAAYLQKMFI